jgi:transposase
MAFIAKKYITLLNWTPQLPDLNPIKNLWAIVKYRRMDEFGVLKTKENLIN